MDIHPLLCSNDAGFFFPLAQYNVDHVIWAMGYKFVKAIMRPLTILAQKAHLYDFDSLASSKNLYHPLITRQVDSYSSSSVIHPVSALPTSVSVHAPAEAEIKASADRRRRPRPESG